MYCAFYKRLRGVLVCLALFVNRASQFVFLGFGYMYIYLKGYKGFERIQKILKGYKRFGRIHEILYIHTLEIYISFYILIHPSKI